MQSPEGGGARPLAGGPERKEQCSESQQSAQNIGNPQAFARDEFAEIFERAGREFGRIDEAGLALDCWTVCDRNGGVCAFELPESVVVALFVVELRAAAAVARERRAKMRRAEQALQRRAAMRVCAQ